LPLRLFNDALSTAEVTLNRIRWEYDSERREGKVQVGVGSGIFEGNIRAFF
jgi:hypothetical protein